MRLTTWNVNGIRNPFAYQPWNSARTYPAMFDILGCDIIVMQELKIQRKDLRDDMVMIDGWDCYFSLPKHKKGYSGVGIYTRNATCAPVKAEEGLLGVLPSPSGVPYCDLPDGESIGGYPNADQVAELGVEPAALDAEGRCLVLEFPAFILFGVYCPANSNGLRDDFRSGFIRALDCRIRNLVRLGKRVVLVGDLNVSRDEFDTAGALDDMRKAGLSHEDYISTPNRRVFNQLLIGGEVIGARDEGRDEGVLWDTTRAFHPDRNGMYTHWEQKINARPGNYGSRIDFVLVSKSMQSWVKHADIQEGLLGSDHCPVFAEFHDDVEIDGKTLRLVDVMNPPRSFADGVKQVEWSLQAVPAFSAKRLPEFDKRRSIKSMFAVPNQSTQRKAAVVTATDEELATSTLPTQQTAPDTILGERLQGARGSVNPGSQPSPLKRSASTLSTSSVSKRAKAGSALSSTKGQQNLKGFFQKKSSDVKDSTTTTSTESTAPLTPHSTSAVNNSEHDEQNGGVQESNTAVQSPRATMSQHALHDFENTSPSKVSAIIAGAEHTQRSWNALFSRPVAPMCEEHHEPCKSMQTKKKGSNQGRSFWMCARPLGPSGQKEKGTQWRCATFIWCSDWVPKRAEAVNGRDNGA